MAAKPSSGSPDPTPATSDENTNHPLIAILQGDRSGHRRRIITDLHHAGVAVEALESLLSGNAQPVVLLEGRRRISATHADTATAVASLLAREFPTLRFRSGNAEGADQAFAAGVAAVDPTRLQIVLPYPGHRKTTHYQDASYDSPASLARVREDELATKAIDATPANRRIIEARAGTGRLAAMANYLIRDTMKVAGHSNTFPPPVLALFYIDPADPDAGGTGHTIRVCRQQGVPVVFQDVWMDWARLLEDVQQ